MSDDEMAASRVERLHELAALGEVGLQVLYGEELKTWLAEFVSSELPGSPVLQVNSSEELVRTIDQLARNKRAWSQRLGSLVIELSDCLTPDAERKVSEALREFIHECPWKYLRESASRRL